MGQSEGDPAEGSEVSAWFVVFRVLFHGGRGASESGLQQNPASRGGEPGARSREPGGQRVGRRVQSARQGQAVIDSQSEGMGKKK